MRRIGRDELVTSIYVALRTAPATAKRAFRSKLPHERDAGTQALAERVCDLINNGGTMVIAADMVGAPHESRLGTFGVTEPDPCA